MYSCKFSIIIPTFNSQAVVKNAIESVLNQTFGNFEVIIQDGLSTDATLSIIKSHQDERIRCFSEKDDGIFDAMNKGIARSRGDWLLFLGSDDSLFERDTLRLVASAADNNPESKFIYGDVFTSANYVQQYQNYTYSKLLDVCICHQSIFYHRSLFSELKYDLKFKICADWDFNLKVFNRENRPVYVRRPFANFNLEGVSNNWIQHPEYLKYFSNKITTILRYKSVAYLLFYLGSSLKDNVILNIKKRVKRFYNKVVVNATQN